MEYQIKNRSLHRDWMFHGLDGAMAARALGMLRAVESAPLLVEQFRRVDPALTKVANPEWVKNPLSWTDFRAKMYTIPALGELACKESKDFLLEYVALNEEKARQFAPPLQEEATQALFRHSLTPDEIDGLLRSESSAVRGTALLECMDHPSPERAAALKRM